MITMEWTLKFRIHIQKIICDYNDNNYYNQSMQIGSSVDPLKLIGY